jgi:DNA-binding MarR family transcriptional regulator
MELRKLPPMTLSDAVVILMRTVLAQSTPIERQTGLTHSQAMLLPCLLFGGKMTATDLANQASLSQPALTSALNVLENRGLIGRVRNGGDRRRVWVALTAEGKNLLTTALRRKHLQHSRINALFPSEESALVARDLSIIAKELGAREEWLGHRCPFCQSANRGAR